jgi:predicted SprT family Zn-dependent metalloprotease
MRTTAGKAYYNLNMIKLNKTLFLENKDKFNQTIGHEIAHLLNYEIYGHTGHNGSWKAIMILLGLKPNRCHEYKVEKRRHKPKGYAYCHCRDNIPLKSKKYTNMIQGINYRCKLCDSRLILINESTLIHEAI